MLLLDHLADIEDDIEREQFLKEERAHGGKGDSGKYTVVHLSGEMRKYMEELDKKDKKKGK